MFSHSNRGRTAAGLLSALLVLLVISCHAQDAPAPLFKADESRPADAIVLFDGKDTSEWTMDDGRPCIWVVKDGYMETKGGGIRTKQVFGDQQLHLEFWLPLMPDARGQDRANSGVYVQGKYEVQILDSYGLKSGGDDCGAIYGVAAPMVNANRPPEQWQTYDIIFRAPRFDEKGDRTANARMTVLHNGVLIQDNVEIPGPTRSAAGGSVSEPGFVMLQDHGAKIRFRNIWVRPL